MYFCCEYVWDEFLCQTQAIAHPPSMIRDRLWFGHNGKFQTFHLYMLFECTFPSRSMLIVYIHAYGFQVSHFCSIIVIITASIVAFLFILFAFAFDCYTNHDEKQSAHFYFCLHTQWHICFRTWFCMWALRCDNIWICDVFHNTKTKCGKYHSKITNRIITQVLHFWFVQIYRTIFVSDCIWFTFAALKICMSTIHDIWLHLLLQNIAEHLCDTLCMQTHTTVSWTSLGFCKVHYQHVLPK